ncbi:MAG: hypothetical protein KatS3mg046_646 [Bellilinea sp.]|nr:MAG: hypothetical protein KatS3mg046_646 [Bellilinea sp.]
MQQAILDEVSVINYSISGGKTPYSDPVELAFLEAFDAGIFVAASAGNLRTEPTTDGQVNHVSPWVMTVAASSHDRRFGHLVDVVDPANSELMGLFAVPGTGPKFTTYLNPIEIRYDENNATGCASFNSDFFADSIALIQRGDCTFATKVNNATAAGAVGVLVFNNSGFAIPMADLETTTIPSAMLDQQDGEALRDYILQVMDESSLPVYVAITAFDRLVGDYGDIKADFSFRGPSYNDFEVLKPDITAPGLEILAAVADGEIEPDLEAEFDLYQGTSMSSPHVAGAAALLKALHPTWSPAAIKSALMMTAKTEGLRKEDRTTPADPFDHGAGRVDLSAAARTALILDETTANFEATDPANGGDPKSLNLPALQDNFCVAACSWTRTFTNVSGVEVSMAITTPTWMTAEPSEFSVESGESQSVTFTADVSTLPMDQWTFGTVRLNTDSAFGDGTEIADLHLPVAVRPKTETEPPRLVSLRPTLEFAVTNQQTVTFIAEFSEEVKDVDVDDFDSVESGGVSGSSVTAISGSGISYTINVDTGSGSGSVGLKLSLAAEISDLAGNQLTEIPTFDPMNVYWIDKTAPTVQSIALLDAAQTNAPQVRFQVTFSEPVSGLKAEDFEVVEEDGLTGSGVESLESQNPGIYTITLFTGGQEGRLGLRLKAGVSASDEAGNTISGLPYFDPEKIYQIDKVAPQVTAVRRLDESPTHATTVRFEVMFSEAVQDVDPADFIVVEKDGLSGSEIIGLSGSTNLFQISLNRGSGNGKLGLLLPENATIQDMVGNSLTNLPFYDSETEYIIEEWIFLYLPVIRK